MELSRRSLFTSTIAFSLFGGLGLAACTSGASGSGTSSAGGSGTAATGVLALNNAGWSHDAENDVYYQIGLSYVASPAAPDYETLGIYVPGTYFTGTDNGDGTHKVTINASGSVNGFTPATAPVVLPVNTPGYASQKPPSQYSYDSISDYMAAGFIYVHAGLRGKDSNSDSYVGNAPWGVTDLKAAVRYLRYNSASLPGAMDRMFVFGHSGGGAQSSVMGASGDSPLYTRYLEYLGAAMTSSDGTTISDAIAGVMAWCPITSLNVGNAAYEWNMGQFASSGTRAEGTWTAAYGKDLATAFAETVNGLGLTDSKGTALKLEQSGEGVYLAGSYYDHVVAEITTSLNNFLADTTFPYTPSSRQMAGMEPGGGGGGPSDGGGTPPLRRGPRGTEPGWGSAPGRRSRFGRWSAPGRRVVRFVDHLQHGGGVHRVPERRNPVGHLRFGQQHRDHHRPARFRHQPEESQQGRRCFRRTGSQRHREHRDGQRHPGASLLEAVPRCAGSQRVHLLVADRLVR